MTVVPLKKEPEPRNQALDNLIYEVCLTNKVLLSKLMYHINNYRICHAQRANDVSLLNERAWNVVKKVGLTLPEELR